MCGILFSVKEYGGETSHPAVFADEIQGDGDSICFESDDRDKIASLLIQPDLDHDLTMSVGDKLKLENVEHLRELNEKLVKLKNNVKRKDDAEISQVELQIDAIANSGIEPETVAETDVFGELVRRIACRGPDYVNYTQRVHGNWDIQSFSSILSLRQPLTKQPVHIDDFVVQFNGELYNEECLRSNDTEFISSRLQHHLSTGDTRSQAVYQTLIELNGEFAIVINDLRDGKVYFGKDSIGKRALLYSLTNGLIVSSVAPTDESKTSYIECQSSVIYVYDMATVSIDTVSYESLWQQYTSDQKIAFSPLQRLYDFEVDKSISSKLASLHQILNNACSIRQTTIHPLHSQNLNESHLGILFSGGLDCTVIAAMISNNIINDNPNHTTYIDLMTVGFDNPRTNMKASESPDRQLSKKSWFHLSQMYNRPNFKIRLVEVDVSYRDWLTHRKRVEKLMFPANTEMDLSIAIAFYFASRCQDGYKTELKYTNDKQPTFEEFLEQEHEFVEVESHYTSRAKVLFSGLGADELFAGYSRHESIFNDVKPDTDGTAIMEKYNELSESLMYDIRVIYERNLGRDDRVIASWGKELRYPFLDNRVINHVINDIEPNLKLSYSWQLKTTKRDKVGKMVKVFVRKWMLRELAGMMGLEWAKDELKRAIQFGAKSAKLEIGQSKAKGTDAL